MVIIVIIIFKLPCSFLQKCTIIYLLIPLFSDIQIASCFVICCTFLVDAGSCFWWFRLKIKLRHLETCNGDQTDFGVYLKIYINLKTMSRVGDWTGSYPKKLFWGSFQLNLMCSIKCFLRILAYRYSYHHRAFFKLYEYMSCVRYMFANIFSHFEGWIPFSLSDGVPWVTIVSFILMKSSYLLLFLMILVLYLRIFC